MIANENFKLIIISWLSVAAYIQARSISHFGDVRIERTDDKWICDMIECPSNAFRCFVSKSNDEPSVLKSVNICYSKDNTTLVQKYYSSPTDPNHRIRQYINSYRNGRYISTHQKSKIKTPPNGTLDNDHPIFKLVAKGVETEIQNQINALRDSLHF